MDCRCITYFANGIPEKKAKVLYAEQGDTAASIFSDRTTAAGWHDKPVFYAVAKEDKRLSKSMPAIWRWCPTHGKSPT